MTYKIEKELIPELEKFRTKIEPTIKPYVEIQAEINQNLTLWQSKFGGLPYLPKNFEYPKTPQGKYLYLLAQLNFAEIPHLENFPQQGILQFYIAGDDLYGCDLENLTSQTGFRILYFPQIIQDINNLITDFNFLPPPEEELPLDDSYSLKFARKTAPISPWDYQFNELFAGEFPSENRNIYDDFMEKYEQEWKSDGHKIGGYPCIIQSDPRLEILAKQEGEKSEESYILLLQMDSMDNIMWGDGGLGTFYIRESALKKLDFSDIIYNYECC